jgi:RNA polymerase sigma factor (sigma-70 family)
MDTVTSATLLEGLKDICDQTAWSRFNSRYRPMVLSFARKLGLSDPDAEDAAQETLLGFLQGYREGQYQREKGKLRSWLCGIAHRKVVDIKRKKRRDPMGPDDTANPVFFDRIESPEEARTAWDEEWQQAVLQACLEEAARGMNPQTLEAFDLYVMQEWPVKKVAEQLGMTTNAVYIAKNRILEQMQKLRPQMEEIW